MNGIKIGYWSQAKKDDLVQKLGKIEHVAPVLLILGAAALIRGKTMEVSPELWAVASWCAAALIMTARE